MKLRLPRRRLWRVAIYLVAVWLVMTAVDLILVQVWREYRVGYRTTRAVGPVLADGRVDYLRVVDERFGRGMTVENNAAVAMFRALGREALAPDQPRDGVTEKLGMERLVEGGKYFVTMEDFRKDRRLPAESPGKGGEEKEQWPPTLGDMAEDLTAGWPPRVDEVTREWVKANGRALDLMVEGSRRERFFIPFDAGRRQELLISVYLKHLKPVREACRGLMTRAALRLEAGDGRGFVDDMAAAHRWARLLARAQTLIERVVGEQIETAACRVDRLGAGSGRLGVAEAKALGKELEAMGELASPVESVDAGERYFVLDVMQWAARGGPGKLAFLMDVILRNPAGDLQGEPRWFVRVATRFLPVRYEETMVRVNSYYDGAVVAWHQPTWALRQDAMRRWTAEIEGRAASQNLVGVFLSSDWPVVYLVPALERSIRVEAETRAQTRLTRAALALAAWRGEHGGYPAGLADLAPGYLDGGVPVDPFTDGELRYARKGAGYRLYSVGPNMVDDGGTAEKPGDDVVADSPGVATSQPAR